jgi:hypothetical protein
VPTRPKLYEVLRTWPSLIETVRRSDPDAFRKQSYFRSTIPLFKIPLGGVGVNGSRSLRMANSEGKRRDVVHSVFNKHSRGVNSDAVPRSIILWRKA